jgi:hypothetical protein
VVLVGQPELRGQKSAFQRSNSLHIVSRFMVHELAFRGAAPLKTARPACRATTCRSTPRGAQAVKASGYMEATLSAMAGDPD